MLKNVVKRSEFVYTTEALYKSYLLLLLEVAIVLVVVFLVRKDTGLELRTEPLFLLLSPLLFHGSICFIHSFH